MFSYLDFFFFFFLGTPFGVLHGDLNPRKGSFT